MNIKDENGITQEEFLKSYSSEKYDKPSLTADVIIFAKDGGKTYVLLIKRKNHPYCGCYAFPGGFANKNESIEQTAKRELLEETHVDSLELFDVGIFSAPGRDPRGWVVSYAYYASVNKNDITPKAGDDAAKAEWFMLDLSVCDNCSCSVRLKNEADEIQFSAGKTLEYKSQTHLAFDHAEMLVKALKRAKSDNNI